MTIFDIECVNDIACMHWHILTQSSALPRFAKADAGSTRQEWPHYNTLGISHTATPEEVRRAYRITAAMDCSGTWL